MIMSSLLLAAGIVQLAPNVVRSQGFDLDGHTATTAELVERPAGTSDEAFARHLIALSGLRPWNGQLYEFPASPGHMGAKSVVSGAGPEVTVYFLPSDTRKPGKVCRISRKNGGMTDASMSAQDWCVASFGLPPLRRVPPVQAVDEPITTKAKPNR